MKMTNAMNWNEAVDIVVIGSGGAGLTAALAAAKNGAKVLVIEKSGKLGGNTSISGGQVWIPNNHHMLAAGLNDSVEAAHAYLEKVVDGAVSKEVIDIFVKAAPKVIEYIEENTPLRFHTMVKFPDYRQEFPGSVTGGRTLDPDPISAEIVGDWAELIHEGPHFSPVTYEENSKWGAFAYPKNIDWDLIAERLADDIRTLGAALVVGLVKGCLDAGVQFEVNTAADRLLRDGNKITGVEITKEGQKYVVQANNGVILASGGFEFNQDYVKRFLRGPINGPIGVPTNTGDGLRMAMEVGADLACLNEAWWCPTMKIDDEEFEDTQVFRLARGERSLPRSIVVNREGKRFVNEAANYNDMAKALHNFDPVAYDHANLPAWIIFDGVFRSKYSIMTLMPGDAEPDWLVRAETLQELAEKVGIHAEQLEKTVARFNQFAKDGKDPDFHRGESKYDSYYGDPENKPNAGLGPIEQGPFYALPIHSGTLGTKGGPVTDADGRVLSPSGEPIPGLYAAGNAAASIMGPGYPGAGGTLGPAITFGYIAGLHAATVAADLKV
jgi:succinate dehydrogenase/fumarate reductase flavoprotein subunit